MRLARRAAAVCFLGLLTAAPAWAQIKPEEQLPKDDIFRRIKPEDMTSQAIALDVHPEWPIVVVGTLEQRQINLGRPIYAVVARNRSVDDVKSYTLAAVIVGRDGKTKAVQRLTTVKNLKAGQERRQDTEIRAGVPSISDHIVFLVAEVEPAVGESWRLDDEALRRLVKEAISGGPPVPQ